MPPLLQEVGRLADDQDRTLRRGASHLVGPVRAVVRHEHQMAVRETMSMFSMRYGDDRVLITTAPRIE